MPALAPASLADMMAAPSTAPQTATSARPSSRHHQANSASDIAKFVGDLAEMLTAAIDEINEINANTRMLALNARIEAARAG
jgi:methyl-accepting chemotaxis protein